MDIKHCAGAVLAGGRSSRMAADKAALPFGGVTLLEWQLDKLRALGLTEIMVSGAGSPAPDAAAVADVWPGRGPLGGIHACLSAARSGSVLFLGVDIPLIPAAVLGELVEAHRGGITLLCRQGKTEPLIGVYDRSLAPAAEQLLRAGPAPVYRLFEAAPPLRVELRGDSGVLLNCNTPEEYRAALGAFRG